VKYSPKQLKSNAKYYLNGNWGTAISCYFAYDIITLLIMYFMNSLPVTTLINTAMDTSAYIGQAIFSFAVELVLAVLFSPFRIGFKRCILNITHSREVRVRDVFSKTETWPKIMLASFIQIGIMVIPLAIPVVMIYLGYYIGIASAVFFILMLFFAIEFALLDFILADNDNISATQAIKQSFRLIKGHKWHYLNLLISFILWFILIMAIALNLGLMLLFPLEIYVHTATAVMYDRIMEDHRFNRTV